MQTDLPKTNLANDNQTDNSTNPDQTHLVTPKKRRKTGKGTFGRYSRTNKRVKPKCSLNPLSTPSPITHPNITHYPIPSE